MDILKYFIMMNGNQLVILVMNMILKMDYMEKVLIKHQHMLYVNKWVMPHLNLSKKIL